MLCDSAATPKWPPGSPLCSMSWNGRNGGLKSSHRQNPPTRALRGASGLGPPAHLGSRFGFGSPGALGLALVVQFLAFCHGDLALNPALFEVNFGGDQCQPFFPRLHQKLIDLAPVQQQLTVADGRMVFPVAV